MKSNEEHLNRVGELLRGCRLIREQAFSQPTFSTQHYTSSKLEELTFFTNGTFRYVEINKSSSSGQSLDAMTGRSNKEEGDWEITSWNGSVAIILSRNGYQIGRWRVVDPGNGYVYLDDEAWLKRPT